MALTYFKVKQGLELPNGAVIIDGTVDPSAGGGVAAPVGSLYLRTNGETWHKTNSGDTQWTMILDSTGSSSEDGYQNTFMGKTGAGSETPSYTGGQASGVVSGDSLESAIDKVDTEIGVAVASPQSRTIGPISDQDVNLNIEALDDAIGPDVTPVTRTNNNPIVAANSSNANIDAVDTAIGDDVVPVTRTNNPIANTNDVGANLEALDKAVGADSDLASTNYVTLNSTLMAKISALDAAVKSSFDGLNTKESVRCATTAVLTGTGLAYAANQITWSAAAGPTTLDGVSLSNGMRILVKDETDAGGTLNQEHNGIYVRTSQDQWDRADDADTWAEHISAYAWVEEGTANADSAWVCTADTGGTLGTTDLFFVLYAAAGSIIAGGGLTKTGDSIDVGDSNKGVQVNTDDLQIDASEIAGNGLAQTAGGGNEHLLTVNPDITTASTTEANAVNVVANGVNIKVDDSTIEGSAQGAGSTESLRVKDGGITAAKLDSGINPPVYSSANNQDPSTGLTADSVAFASYGCVEWLVSIKAIAGDADRYAAKVLALNDGTVSNVDYTIYGELVVGSAISGLSVTVDLNGSDMRLRITASENISYRVTRIAHAD